MKIDKETKKQFSQIASRQRGTLTGGFGWLFVPLILFFFFAFTSSTFAATYYWVGNSDYYSNIDLIML